jgi:hypothetical protein
MDKPHSCLISSQTAGVRNDCQHGRGNAPKGQTPILRKKAKRFSTNMISSVTNQGKVRWMIYRETLNSEVFIRFMERLIKDSKKEGLSHCGQSASSS